jgi:serine/threonine-protein kinase
VSSAAEKGSEAAPRLRVDEDTPSGPQPQIQPGTRTDSAPAGSAPVAESVHVPGATAPDPLLGKTLANRFRVLEHAGQGGMGRVYKALQLPLERLVALKVVATANLALRDPGFYKRFALEASITSRLSHPNTITIYDYGQTDDGILFIAMEYLQGRTLSKVLQEGPLAPDRVLHVAQQIARSLREAHAHKVIHRDLKPANVMLVNHPDDPDFVKVLDFGLVKVFQGEDPDATEITQTGTFMGSPHYIAPEQARNAQPDQRCDIYSLGVLMYQMATGKVPFHAPNSVDVILKHLHEPPPPWKQMRPDLHLPPELEACVMKCLQKDREKRYRDMDELLADLRAVRVQYYGSSGPQSGAYAADDFVIDDEVSKPAVSPARRSRAPALALAIATLALIGGAAGFYLRQRAQAPSAPARATFAPRPPTPAAGEPAGGRELQGAPVPRPTGILSQGSDIASAAPGAETPVAAAAAEAPAPVEVSIASFPIGAEVFENGRPIGKAPLTLTRAAAPGPDAALLELEFRLPGHRPQQISRPLTPPKMSVNVVLLPLPEGGYREDPY